ncbi:MULTISPECIES: hypothetical protein [Pacificimonas]|nr:MULTISPECIES: hypothetical protein [Pacificimonas]MBZ6377912.1 hypothetical protein [Pacificimonas aurantium]
MFGKVGLALAAALAVSLPARATLTKIGDDVTLDLSNSGSCSSSSNDCTYTAFYGSGQSVNVRATAWTIEGGSGFDSGTHRRGDLERYSSGLGVVNSDGDNSHTVDNSGWRDYIAFEFSEQVTLESVKLALFGDQPDSDVSVVIGNVPTGLDAYTNPLEALEDWQSGYAIDNDYSGGSGYNGWITQDGFDFGEADAGNVVLVAADLFENDYKDDYFKVDELTFDIYQQGSTPPTGVPGPAPIALLGLGLLGVGVRQRKRRAA